MTTSTVPPSSSTPAGAMRESPATAAQNLDPAAAMNERADINARFAQELAKATGDGSKKRQAGTKPRWDFDPAHEAAIFSHITRWKRGDQIDPHSGAHPLVHAAWRCLAIACRESGNVPAPIREN